MPYVMAWLNQLIGLIFIVFLFSTDDFSGCHTRPQKSRIVCEGFSERKIRASFGVSVSSESFRWIN
jgi:hypothetical protein